MAFAIFLNGEWRQPGGMYQRVVGLYFVKNNYDPRGGDWTTTIAKTPRNRLTRFLCFGLGSATLPLSLAIGTGT